MKKIHKASLARLVKTQSQTWYFVWYDSNKKRYRETFDINRVNDPTQKQFHADRILAALNEAIFRGEKPILTYDVGQLVETNSNAPALPTFAQHVDNIIEAKKELRKKGTIKALATLRNNLREFANLVLKKDFVEFSDITSEFVVQFQKFAFKVKNHSQNYFAKQMAMFKLFLNEIEDFYRDRDLKMPISEAWKSKKFRPERTEVDTIALSMSEVKQLFHVHLDNKTQAHVRDVFVFACLTGLRFSDVTALTRDHIQPLSKDGQTIEVVKIVTQKTGQTVVIPLHPIAKTILERNGGGLPKVSSNQVFNRYVKKVAEIAQLNDIVQLRENVGGTNYQRRYKKWEVISTHSARRTFVTIAYCEWKIPAATLMQITGHTSEYQFFQYVKQNKENAAFDVAQVWLQQF